MSDFWKVAGVFIGVIGAAAIIFQLNKGTLVQSGANTFTTAIGDAFSSAPATPAPAPTNKTPHTTSYSTTG